MIRSTSANSRPANKFILAALIPLGLVVTYFTFVKPVMLVLDARNWNATQCGIVSSGVKVNSGRHGGATYRVDIEFKYRWEGREYTSDQYQFDHSYSSGRVLKQAVADQYPAWTSATCYVNPHDPSEAVIQRGFTVGMLVGLCPLVFTIAGWLGLVGSYRKSHPETELHKLVSFVVIVAVIDGVFLSIVFGLLVPEARLHYMDWGLMLFLIPFGLIAAVMTAICVGSGLELVRAQGS